MDINSSLDYNIVMTDGSELGMIGSEQTRWFADEAPPNGGVIIQFGLTTAIITPPQLWVSGGKAFIRGAYYEDDNVFQKWLYVFRVGLPSTLHVGWTSDKSKATRFMAIKVDGNRVALWAEIKLRNELVAKGIRLNRFTPPNVPDGTFRVDQSKLAISLSCQFVRVQTLPSRIMP